MGRANHGGLLGKLSEAPDDLAHFVVMLLVPIGGRPVRQQDLRLRREVQVDHEIPQDSRLFLPGSGKVRLLDRERLVALRFYLGLADKFGRPAA